MLRVILAAVATSILLLGASAAGVERVIEQPPSATGPWPEGGYLTVNLCYPGSVEKKCGGKEVPFEQQLAVQRWLRERPGIADLRLRSRPELKAQLEALIPGIGRLSPDDELWEAFEGRLLRWSDAAALYAAVKELPGVFSVSVWPTDFWDGKADVHLWLCAVQDEEDPCKGRGRATSQERAAIEAVLKGTRGVRHIYFVDRTHTRWVNRRFFDRWSESYKRDEKDTGEPAPLKPLVEFSESYYVKFDDPGLAKPLLDRYKTLPGVAVVRLQRSM
jgi:hypothetical protein